MAINHKDIPDAELHEPKGAAGATAGQVPVADGSGNTSFQSVGGVATHISEIYIEGNSTETVINTVDVDEQIVAGWQAGEINGLTFSADHLLVPTGGDGLYIVSMGISFTAVNTNKVWHFTLGVDTGSGFVAHPHAHARMKTDQNTDVKHIHVTTLVNLSAGDKIGILVNNETDVSNIIVSEANMVARFEG